MSLPGVPPIQQLTVGALVDQVGALLPIPQNYFQLENALLTAMAQAVNAALGVNAWTLAQAQALSLGVSDAGYIAYITDYAHTIRWTGTAWVFLDGGGGFLQDFAVFPQGNGWQVCDGSATTYLTVGATLVATAFTTPNLSGSAAYRKSGAYTGSIVAASAPGATMSGSTATGSTGTGATGTGATGTSTTSGNTDVDTDLGVAYSGSATSPGVAAALNHHHPITNLPIPSLSVPSLSVPSLSIPALGAGTLAATVDATGEPAHLAVAVYFRR
jgi:hypothetical protein